MHSCDGSCKAYGKCACGSLRDGDFIANRTVRVSMLLADGAIRSDRAMTTITDTERAEARRHAAYDHMCEKMAAAWQGAAPVNNNRQRAFDAVAAPQYTKDGRHVSTLSDSDRVYHEMLNRDSCAWQR